MTATQITAIVDTQVTPEQAADFTKRRRALLDFCRLNPGCGPGDVVEYLGRLRPAQEPERKLFMHWMSAQEIRELQQRTH